MLLSKHRILRYAFCERNLCADSDVLSFDLASVQVSCSMMLRDILDFCCSCLLGSHCSQLCKWHHGLQEFNVSSGSGSSDQCGMKADVPSSDSSDESMPDQDIHHEDSESHEVCPMLCSCCQVYAHQDSSCTSCTTLWSRLA